MRNAIEVGLNLAYSILYSLANLTKSVELVKKTLPEGGELMIGKLNNMIRLRNMRPDHNLSKSETGDFAERPALTNPV